MPCRSFMCEHEAGCLDVRCPGHPYMAQDDAPLTTPEDTRMVLWALALFAIACLVAAAFFGVQLDFPFE